MSLSRHGRPLRSAGDCSFIASIPAMLMAGTRTPSSSPGTSPNESAGNAQSDRRPSRAIVPSSRRLKQAVLKPTPSQVKLARLLRRLRRQRRRAGIHQSGLRPGGVRPLHPELDVTVVAGDPPDPGIEPPPSEQPGPDAGSGQRVNYEVDHLQLSLCRRVRRARVLQFAGGAYPPGKHGQARGVCSHCPRGAAASRNHHRQPADKAGSCQMRRMLSGR